MCLNLKQLLLGVIAVALLISRAKGNEYCDIACDMGKHTMCLYPTEALGPACKNFDPQLSSLYQTHKDAIVKLHNDYRSNVAMGKELRGGPGPQYEAADMMEIVWDLELEEIATRYSRQCVYAHDDCRNRRNGQHVGQNLGIKAGKFEDFLSNIKKFYGEVALFDMQLVNANHRVFDKSGKELTIGHYAQLIHAESRAIGCARSRFHYSKYNATTELLVCNYAPGGNIPGEKIYTVGKACSGCPDGITCSKTYPGLCENPLTLSLRGDQNKNIAGNRENSEIGNTSSRIVSFSLTILVMITYTVIICYTLL